MKQINQSTRKRTKGIHKPRTVIQLNTHLSGSSKPYNFLGHMNIPHSSKSYTLSRGRNSICLSPPYYIAQGRSQPHATLAMAWGVEDDSLVNCIATLCTI
jgi:hypothetical protein